MLTSQHMEHVITRDEVMEIERDLEGGGGRGDGDDDGGAGPRTEAQHCLPHVQHRIRHVQHRIRHVQHRLRHVQHRQVLRSTTRRFWSLASSSPV